MTRANSSRELGYAKRMTPSPALMSAIAINPWPATGDRSKTTVAVGE